MTEDIKKENIADENTSPSTKKLFAEGRGRYSLLDNQKVFHFDFPINSALEENLAAIAFIKEEILKTIENKDKAEKEKKEEGKQEERKIIEPS